MPTAPAVRVMIADDPFGEPVDAPWDGGAPWPARWVGLADRPAPPWVAAFRLRFTLATPAHTRIHVSADERYELFLDGVRVGRGPTRCLANAWAYESYTLNLEAGAHVLAARVWALGELAPLAQLSLRPGFLLGAEAPSLRALLDTGTGAWEGLRLEGYRFTAPLAAFGAGAAQDLDAARFTWDFAEGGGTGWAPVAPLAPAYAAATRNDAGPADHLLAPSPLPAMLERPRSAGRLRHLSAPPPGPTHALRLTAADHLDAEAPDWEALLRGAAPLIIPPHTRRRAIIDLDDYLCAYPELDVVGGADARLRLHWQESLFERRSDWSRLQRGDVLDRYFTTIWHDRDGFGDSWRLDGAARRLDTLWWRAGRFVELLVETSDAPLTITGLRLRETRYPLEIAATWHADQPALAEIARICRRALECCAHETFVDCPHYEQLMYIGDARITNLLTYVLSHDDRLPRRALTLLGAALPGGLFGSRAPSRRRQFIPPFSLWWVAMLHDFLFWRGDRAFVAELLPSARTILSSFLALRGPNGLVRSPAGWNHADWLPEWPYGVPPGGASGGFSPLLNWQLAYSLERAAVLEDTCGEAALAAHWRRCAGTLVAALEATCWHPEHGLYAEDADRSVFCAHSQALAALCATVPSPRRRALAGALERGVGMLPASLFFSHYVFEALAVNGRGAAMLSRLEPWHTMIALDFKTTYEHSSPQRTRSDCHAWAAHPLLHFYTSILGVRPAAPGFEAVTITPQLGPLRHVHAQLVHPCGQIEVNLEQTRRGPRGAISLPAGIPGELRLGRRRISLPAGARITLAPPDTYR